MSGVTLTLQEGMHFRAVGTDGMAIDLDAGPEHGGQGQGLRPMELLLMGLGGCTGMDVLSILRKKRQRVTGYRVEVSGEQAAGYPHVFTHIHVHHIVTGDGISADALRRSIELSETKYCPAYAMLARSAEITSDFEIRQASGG